MSYKITDQWQKFLRESKQAVKEKFSPDDFKDVYNTARMAHVGQSRRDGSEYFSHPSEVRNITAKFYPKDRVAQLAALLHDSLEDAPGSTVSSAEEMEEFIRGSIQDPAAGDEVIRVVRALTHEKGGDYLSYVVDLMGDVPTLRVKLSDMVHNLTDNPSSKQKVKYKSALDAISQKTGGNPPNGISDKHWETLMSLSSEDVSEAVLSMDDMDALNDKVDEFGYTKEGLYELVIKVFQAMDSGDVSKILSQLKKTNEEASVEDVVEYIAEKILDKDDGEYQRSIVKPIKMKEEEELAEEPAKGKKYSKTVTNPETGRKKKVSYGAKGYRIAPGTSKGDSYCARSYGIKKGLSKDKQNDPNTPNNLSRKKWKCRGKKSMKEEYTTEEIRMVIGDVIGKLEEAGKCQKGWKTHDTKKTKELYGKQYRNCVPADESLRDRVRQTIERKLEEKKKKGKGGTPGQEICPAGKAWAKRKFETYPSVYANLAASKYCTDPNYAKKDKGKKNEEADLDEGELQNWLDKKWVRVTSSGKIAGECGTSKDKKNPDRCLPKAKAQSMSKGERAATARKKKEAQKSGKDSGKTSNVKNTKKGTVTKKHSGQ